VVVSGLGVAGAGLANLAGYPGLDVGVLAGGVGLGAAAFVSGVRRDRRALVHDRLVEDLAQLLGLSRPTRVAVVVGGWTKGWPGVPKKITLRYAPQAPSSDDQWLAAVLDAITDRLLVNYQVLRHDKLRSRIYLQMTGDRVERVERTFQVSRAERVMRELIGPSVRLQSVELAADGDLQSITVGHRAGTRLAASGYRARVERVFSTTHPGRWRAVWDLERDTVRLERRPSLPPSIWVPTRPRGVAEDLLAHYRDVRIPLGIDEDGEEVVWSPAVVPHLMLTGTTGSGKTSTIGGVVGQFTSLFEWPVWILDAKRVEFLGFRDWPNVQVVAGSIPDQVALVHRVWELMEHRYRLIERGEARNTDFEPLLVVLDEFAEFRSGLLEWYPTVKPKGGASKPPSLAEVQSLARKARTARIHLVLSTQRPDAEFLSGEARDNLRMRVSHGRLSPQGAMMMWENAFTGVSLPRLVPGRAMGTNAAGDPVEIQTYRFPSFETVPGSDEHQLLARLRPTQTLHPRLLIVPPEDDKSREEDPVFRDYALAEWVLATDRPDLDPLQRTLLAGLDGRELSSPLASLGLLGDKIPPRPRLELPWSDALPDVVDDAGSREWGTAVAYDDYDGYSEPTACSPLSLGVGDLIEADSGSGLWVVVDEAPVDDPLEPGAVAVSWRGDADECGSLSLPIDTDISVRRPLEDQ